MRTRRRRETSIAALVLAAGLTAPAGGGRTPPSGVRVPADVPAGSASRLLADPGRTPLQFAPSLESGPDGAVFIARTPRYALRVLRDGLSFDGVRLVFRGANPRPAIVPLEPTGARLNLFLGRDPAGWRTDLPCYGAVLFRRVYPGIDFKIYGSAADVEYDWILRPGADPGRIRIEFEGALEAEIDAAGNLAVGTATGNMIHSKPSARQVEGGRTRAVEASFRKRPDGTFGFRLGAYDRALPLTIDPAVLAFSTYLGGDLNDYASAVAVDAAGCIYVTGKTRSANFPLKAPFQTDRAIEDAFVAKFAPSGRSLVYSTYVGGSDYDFALAVAVDAAGCATISGGTLSSDWPLKKPVQTDRPGRDAFITKLSAAGNSLVYSTYLGGGDLDEAYDLALDAAGNAVVVGRTDSSDFPTLTPIQSDRPRGDGFVAKLNGATGVLLFSTYWGGSGVDYINGVALDSKDAVYLAGYTESPDLRLKTPFQADRPGPDAFVAKLAPNGRSLVYATYLGGGSLDMATSIAVDAAGCAYVAGWTDSGNFPLKHPYQKDRPGRDAFLAELAPSGTTLVFSTYLGGSGDDLAWAVAVGSDRSAYLAGETTSADFPRKGSFQGDRPDSDAFVARIKPDGSGLVYSSYLGGNGADYAYGAALDSTGSLYIAGWTASTDFPTIKPFQGDRGDRDAFLAKVVFGR